jgi:hypothetical protein
MIKLDRAAGRISQRYRFEGGHEGFFVIGSPFRFARPASDHRAPTLDDAIE